MLALASGGCNNRLEACAMEHTYDFDLAVIGSGPGGQKAAIMAAKLGNKVCVIDSKTMVGGVCVNTGTIPSKTLREAVMYLTGMQLREMYGASYRVKDEITIADLLARLQHVIGRETEVIRSQLLRNHIELIPGIGQLPRPAHPVDRHRRPAGPPHPDRRQDRHRHRHRCRPGRPTSSSTAPGCSTPTRSSSWRRCPTRWSWSAPA